ncbi:uncharacterized protein LOC144704969 [Wolffia australiana]
MIIVDETPMMYHLMYEMLDQLFRDVMKSIDASLEMVFFGDRVVVMGAKTILTPLNDDVVKVNNMVLDIFPGEVMAFFSFDAIPPGKVDNESLYPTKFLNTIDDAIVPLHKLRLKIRIIDILLQNLNTVQGLCNRTRLRVDDFSSTMPQATIVSQGNF